jgi:hypothetical protein
MPRWTEAEIRVVHDHRDMTPEELTPELPRRSADAIACCRIGINRWLTNQPLAGFLPRIGVQLMERLHPDLAAQR